jgi:hypothetical protein
MGRGLWWGSFGWIGAYMVQRVCACTRVLGPHLGMIHHHNSPCRHTATLADNRTRASAPSGDATTRVDNPLLPGWVRVRWDAAGTRTNSYEAGARDLYALSLATVTPGTPRGLRAEAVSEANAGGATAGVRLWWRPPSDVGTPGGWAICAPQKLILSHPLRSQTYPISTPTQTAMTAYCIYRDGALLHTSDGTADCTFHDKAALSGATHTYAVAGVSPLGEGERCEALEVYVVHPQDRRALLKLGVTGQSLYNADRARGRHPIVITSFQSIRPLINSNPAPSPPTLKTGDGHLQFLYGAAHLPGRAPEEKQLSVVTLDGGALDDERWTHVAITLEQRCVRVCVCRQEEADNQLTGCGPTVGSHDSHDECIHTKRFRNSTGQLRLFVNGAQRDAKTLPAPMTAARLSRCLARDRPIYLGALGAAHDHWEG